jgi:lysophospholipase L1-like esterase
MNNLRIILSFFIFFMTCIFSPPAHADKIIIDGDLKISSGGSLIFPDGSVQYQATVQGPKGDKGDTGAAGPQGQQGPPGTSAVTQFEQLNYYALGDSITRGSGSTSGTYSYADVLNSKLHFNSFTNLGIGGATVMPTQGHVGELSNEVNAIGAEAGIITILIGLNDYYAGNPLGDVNSVLSKPYAILNKYLSFSEAFRYCLETLKRNHEEARIYVILPLQTNLAGSGEPLEQFRYAETKIANYLSIPVIYANLESGLWVGGTLLPDGIHPNDAGYMLLGNYLARKLSSL